MTATRPTVQLTGEDGNSYAILGRCRQAARKAGWSETEWIEFRINATAGNYHQLLAAVQDAFDVE